MCFVCGIRNSQHGKAPTTADQLPDGIVFGVQNPSTHRAAELNRHYLILMEYTTRLTILFYE
jgi:hypothetical protein